MLYIFSNLYQFHISSIFFASFFYTIFISFCWNLVFCLNRKIFWTDWGVQPHIKSADTDGEDITTIVDTNLGWPNGLTIDYSERRLFWADARTDL